MECPVCSLLNPPESSRCDCGYDFKERTGGFRSPFLVRYRGVFLAAFFIAAFIVMVFTMNTLNAVMLSVVIIPHIALGIAWVTWGRPPLQDHARGARTFVLFLALIACSLNIAIFWGHVAWLNLRRLDPPSWKAGSGAEEVCALLSVFALLAGVCGKGRAQVPLLFAAMTGWAIWFIGGVGVL